MRWQGETEDLYLERAQTRKYSSMLSPSASQINRSETHTVGVFWNVLTIMSPCPILICL